MHWSRIRLDIVGPQRQRRSDRSPWYTIDLPLLSDGRVAMHEFTANRHRAVVKREISGETEVRGSLVLKDKQCICTWADQHSDSVPDIRLIGASFELGAMVALRPGFGPAQLYEVVECYPLPAIEREDKVTTSANDPA